MSYYEKYIKYKNKYLELKKQSGGQDKEIELLLGKINFNDEKVIGFLETFLGTPENKLLNRTAKKLKKEDFNVETLKLISDKSGYLFQYILCDYFNERVKCELDKSGKINNYIDYLSDHPIIISKTPELVIVSFNVEHSDQVRAKIEKFILNICHKNKRVTKDKHGNWKVKDEYRDQYNSFIGEVMNLKNKEILFKLKFICEKNPDKKIIINIQEGYPSLYKTIVEGISYCRPTKLVCQNLKEMFTKHSPGRLLLVNDVGLVPREKINEQLVRTKIQEISDDITNCNYQINNGRPYNSGCFFSFVVANPPFESKYSVIDDFGSFNQLFSTSDYLNIKSPTYEDKLGTAILKNQELPILQNILIKSKPTLLTYKIAQYTSRMLTQNVNFGSVTLICEGIHLVNEGVINVHLKQDRTNGFGYLFSSLSENQINNIYKIFNTTNGSEIDTAYYESDSLLIHPNRYSKLIQELKAEYESDEPVVVPIKWVVGDFNSRRSGMPANIKNKDVGVKYYKSPGANTEKDIDYIIKFD